ncbi:CpsB/CapC family capsule biosynthesis tyrosine phosphatase [uncultured Eubacterium sp.]|uniref:CpsB/CapC family capsule biosynthesis tyrosine phosphatase n=1 Tax=uncultured Eubacterium sp. TaxID=165185 RepID=UPI002671C8B5|nr:CpsB/CapC family capsule biosynthesis tyrosine phosphatase [uncultured Eubacterium sp.]
MVDITDIHSHILFQVDDGSPSIETSLEILKKEYQQGVRNVICTPHYHAGECMPKPDVIKKNFLTLKREVIKEIPGLELFLGNEIMACNDMVELLERGELFTLADSNYVLVEFYPTVQYAQMERSINSFLNGGYTPIIAHCERYKCLRNTLRTINSRNISHLIEKGAYLQVNTESVFGKNHKFVSKLIDNDFLHLIASDAHNLGRRGVYWKECIKYLEKRYNDDYLHWLLIENPAKVLKGEYI